MAGPSSGSTTGSNYLQYQTPSTPLQQTGDSSGLYYQTPSTPLQQTPGPTQSSGGGAPGLFSQASSGLSSLLGGANVGNLALYGGLYGLLSTQASAAASENKNLAGQITGIGQPAVNESQNLLSAYSSGGLTQPFSDQLTAAIMANANTANSESQQSAQLLANAGGGANLTGAAAGQQQQIRQAQTQANITATANAFTSELSASNGLLAAGGPYVQAGVQQEIASNTALQGQLADLMGALANAHAKSVAGTGTAAQQQKPATSGGAGTGSGGGGGGQPGGGGGLGPGGSQTIPPGYVPGFGQNPPLNDPGSQLPGLPDLPYVNLPGYLAPYTPPNFEPGGNVSTGPLTGTDPGSGLEYIQPGGDIGGYSAPNFGYGAAGSEDGGNYWNYYG